MLFCLCQNSENALFEQNDIKTGAGVAAAGHMISEIGDGGAYAVVPQTGLFQFCVACFGQGFPFPEWKQFIAYYPFIRFADIIGVLRAGSDGIQFRFQPVPGNIRENAPARGFPQGGPTISSPGWISMVPFRTRGENFLQCADLLEGLGIFRLFP